MPKLRLIKDDPSLQDIIPFPSALDGHIGGRLGARFGRTPGRTAGASAQQSVDLEQHLLGTIDRMKMQLDELSDLIGPFPLFPDDDRPTAA
jgi:hypothetical protein